MAAGAADNVGANSDQMVLWPPAPAKPTHLIAVNEEGTGSPGLQKIDLTTGVATTILTGIDDNDPVRTTPWGTVIFGEEASDGAMYEIVDPLSVVGATFDRVTGISSGPNIRRVNALGFNSFEGLATTGPRTWISTPTHWRQATFASVGTTRVVTQHATSAR